MASAVTSPASSVGVLPHTIVFALFGAGSVTDVTGHMGVGPALLICLAVLLVVAARRSRRVRGFATLRSS